MVRVERFFAGTVIHVPAGQKVAQTEDLRLLCRNINARLLFVLSRRGLCHGTAYDGALRETILRFIRKPPAWCTGRMIKPFGLRGLTSSTLVLLYLLLRSEIRPEPARSELMFAPFDLLFFRARNQEAVNLCFWLGN